MTNVVLFTVDDMNGDTPGCFGGPSEVTPRIDAFAAEGMRFVHAHVTIAVCQPSRSVMLTGRYPHRSGALGFLPIDDGVPVLTDSLRAAGYRCGIVGKVDHIEPIERMGWHLITYGDELASGRDSDRYREVVRDFIDDAGGEDAPFFLMVNAHDPHRPFHGSDEERGIYDFETLATIPDPSHVYEAGDWPVPGFLPDLPEIRQEVAEYLSSCRRADDVFGEVMDELESSGVADDTLVIFLSDNGMAFPFAKTNCYLQSTRTPWIVRWPGRVVPGSVDDEHFIEGIDLMPTVLDALGLAIPDGVDGRSSLPLLEGDATYGRDRIVTVFHETALGALMREIGEDPWHAQFEMRCVQDAGWGYIWNAWSDGEKAFSNESQNGRSWAAMVAASANDPAVQARTRFFTLRAREELYDLSNDPDGLKNLIAATESASILAELRSHLLEWMRRTGDPLLGRYDAEFVRG
jgi:N-sulfoglucosamine sulfohydrolase